MKIRFNGTSCCVLRSSLLYCSSKLDEVIQIHERCRDPYVNKVKSVIDRAARMGAHS